MEQVKLTTGEYLLETIPSDAYDFKLSRDNPDDPTYISYLRKSTGNYRDGYDLYLLQPQHYEIIGRASELPTIGSGDLLIAVVENDMNPETTLVIRKIK